MKVHLTALGGTGMGQLGGLLKEAGHEVRGSDLDIYPPMSTMLAELSIPVMKGFAAQNLDWNPELVVVGNVCRRDNPEAVEAEKRGIRRTSFPVALYDFFISSKHSVVVAGTHGKTTTTALIAWVLQSAGSSPSFLVGGVPLNFGRGFGLGSGEHFVVEGDEYDTAFFDKGPKFMHYKPRTAIITSVEFDHADIYRDLAQVEEAFSRFAATVSADGVLVACGEESGAMAVSRSAAAQVLTYGLGEGWDFRPADIRSGEHGTSFTLLTRGERAANFMVPMWGRHNVLNAVGAIVVCSALGLSAGEIAEALTGFRGVRRRQELAADIGGIRIVDDFAHHPTAVAGTIASMRSRFAEGRIWAIFEPRSATSCRKVFREQFIQALSAADIAVVAANYRASQLAEQERLDPEELVSEMARRGFPACYIPDVSAIVEQVAAEARSSDVILVMSNGMFGGLVEKLKERIAFGKGT